VTARRTVSARSSSEEAITLTKFTQQRRIEIDKIDTRIWELAPVAQPLQIVAEIQPIHAIMFIVTSSGALVASQLQHTLPDDSEALLAPVEQRTLSVPISEAN
jgi:hypothetical protein